MQHGIPDRDVRVKVSKLAQNISREDEARQPHFQGVSPLQQFLFRA